MIYAKFLNQILHEASKIAKRMFGKVSGIDKPSDPMQVLTVADLAVGKLIVARIHKAYPRHNIIDEEQGAVSKQSEYTWVVDPIDGTSNFAEGTPLYGVMIGLLKAGKPVAAGVSLPSWGQIYIAEKGRGAYCNSKKISVTKRTRLQSCLVSCMFENRYVGHKMNQREVRILGRVVSRIRNMRNSGSVFDDMMVASGKYAGAICNSSKIWDNVAQHIMVEEAGGIYTDLYGEPMDYSKPLSRTKQNYTYCAASPKIHKKLQEIINKVK